MKNNHRATKKFEALKIKGALNKEVLKKVYHAHKEKGYDPIDQIIGYLISGDPAYITSHNNARNLMRQLERHTLLEDMLRNYLEK